MKIGVVSDTHGLLRPQVISALEGVEHILHLGDVGNASILQSLEQLAPVHAVRGNIDRSGPCARLPENDVVLFAGHYLYLLHELSALQIDPVAAKFSAVLYGHSHRPRIERRKGVLYFNPGSCGPRRFELPITVGLLTIRANSPLDAEIVNLGIPIG